MFHFGSRALAEIAFAPEQLAPPLTGRHGLTFWLKHAQFAFTSQQDLEQPEELAHHVKEHLACITRIGSGEHIYALFVRNCKLNLMLRPSKLAGVGLEWRWHPKLNETCDDTWHLYTINVDLEKLSAELYVDGRQQEHRRPVRLRPLNRRPRDESLASRSRVSLGTCWSERRQSSYGNLNGSLAGLQTIHGAMEDPNTIACMAAAGNAGIALGTYSSPLSASSNSPPLASLVSQEVEFDATDPRNLNKLVLLALEPTWAESLASTHTSKLTLRGSVQLDCTAEHGKYQLLDGFIEPMQVEVELARDTRQPANRLNLFGSVGSLRNRTALVNGVLLLDQLEIQTTPEGMALESCSILPLAIDGTYTNLEPAEELMLFERERLKEARLSLHETNFGLVIFGYASAAEYQSILSKLIYKVNETWQPQNAQERSFSIVCSAANSLVVSNKHQVTIQLDQGQESTPKASLVYLDRANSAANQLSWADGSLRDAMETSATLGVSRRIDRIGVAFLVFVISLVVIVLVITLANIREPSTRSPVAELYEERSDSDSESVCSRFSSSRYAKGSATYYDIDSAAAACRQVLDVEDTSADGRDHARSKYRPIEPARIVRCTRKSGRSSPRSSVTEESLAWDNELYLNSDAEAEEEVNSAKIVMNPLAFCPKPAKMSIVAEQPTGKSERVRTQLSTRAPELRRRHRRECSRHYEEAICPRNLGDQMLAMDEYTSTSSSSCSSSESNSSDTDSDVPCMHNGTMNSSSEDTGSDASHKSNRCRLARGRVGCNRHQRSVSPTLSESSLGESSSNEVGATYELYHRHNIHHTCLRQQGLSTCAARTQCQSLSDRAHSGQAGARRCNHRDVGTYTSSI